MSFWETYAEAYTQEDGNMALADIVNEILANEQLEATNTLHPVDLWLHTNFNSFKKVNTFGKTIQFWFEREPNVEYTTSLGWVENYSSDTVILHVDLK